MSNAVKICYISQHHFGFRALAGILESEPYARGKLQVSLLVSLDPLNKDSTVGFHDFGALAAEYGIRHKVVRSVKEADTLRLIEQATPDYLLAIGLSELVPAKILDMPKLFNNGVGRHSTTHGCIGMHPTLLPQGRGRAPIPWAIIKGLNKTGVTAFLLEDAPDAGGIILQEHIGIEPTETATTLFAKCADAHHALACQLAPILADRMLTWVEQDPSQASLWRKRTPADGLIDFDQDLDSIDRLVRAIASPYPGAFFYYQGQKVFVDKIETHLEDHSNTIGMIVAISPQGLPLIAAQNGIVECVSIHRSEAEPFSVGEIITLP